MKTKSRHDGNHGDFREYLFTASGADTDVANFDLIDLADNLASEFRQLEAVAEMLGCANDHFDVRALSGVSQILADICRRSRALLKVALDQGKR